MELPRRLAVVLNRPSVARQLESAISATLSVLASLASFQAINSCPQNHLHGACLQLELHYLSNRIEAPHG